MTLRPDRWAAYGNPWQPEAMGRRHARLMSRRFAEVGVRMSAARLREMALTESPTPADRVDIAFALVAIEIKHEQRLARVRSNRRRLRNAVVVAGLMIAALNLLICLGYLFVILAVHQPMM